ncbi:unnamed protein product (mitochondrion) [Plasmodiophora brassicae]|uniref:Sfi1 spindle body domain-containing protein n=1 Tax=Plasmodiophora brassicae TaxID=37360 RepID=A0A0G4IK45_PLABS|nr:hypothetical protein PBRA_004258 [Plasmodiophora brassicae]SPR00408.1 unnamed protein product [Plasmodiophora brassicae]
MAGARDWHDIVGREVASVPPSPYRLCTGLAKYNRRSTAPVITSGQKRTRDMGRRGKPADASCDIIGDITSAYEHLLNVEPVSYRPVHVAKQDIEPPSAVPPPKLAEPPARSLAAIYDLLSDDIFHSQNRNDEKIIDEEPAYRPSRKEAVNAKPATSNASTRAATVVAPCSHPTRARVIAASAGGQSRSHNVAIARRVEEGIRRRQRYAAQCTKEVLRHHEETRRATSPPSSPGPAKRTKTQHRNAALTTLHDIVEDCLANAADDAASSSSASGTDDDVDAPEEISPALYVIRLQSIRLIGEKVRELRREQRIKERALNNAVDELQEKVRVSSAIALNLKRDHASVVVERAPMIMGLRQGAYVRRRPRRSVRLEDVLMKIRLARSLAVKTTAQIFLVTLCNLSALSRLRRALVDRMHARFPAMLQTASFRLWARSTPVRDHDRPQLAASLIQWRRDRLLRNALTVWHLRLIQVRRNEMLDRLAAAYAASNPFYRWHEAYRRRLRLRDELQHRVDGITSPPGDSRHAICRAEFKARCATAVRNTSGIASGPGRPPAREPVPDHRAQRPTLMRLADMLADRSARRAAFVRWRSALCAVDLSRHVDALGRFRRGRRALSRWRHATRMAREADSLAMYSCLRGSFLHWMTVFDGRNRTRHLVSEVVYPLRLQKRLWHRWRSRASLRRPHAQIAFNRMRACLSSAFRRWTLATLQKRRLRRALDRAHTAHLQHEWRRLWQRWRNRCKQARVLSRVLRDAVYRWKERVEHPQHERNVELQTAVFSAWRAFACRERTQRVRRCQQSTAEIFDSLRRKVDAMGIWKRAVDRARAFRAWRRVVAEVVHRRKRFVVKWRYLVPLKKAFRALQVNATADAASSLFWKTHIR